MATPLSVVFRGFFLPLPRSVLFLSVARFFKKKKEYFGSFPASPSFEEQAGEPRNTTDSFVSTKLTASWSPVEFNVDHVYYITPRCV